MEDSISPAVPLYRSPSAEHLISKSYGSRTRFMVFRVDQICCALFNLKTLPLPKRSLRRPLRSPQSHRASFPWPAHDAQSHLSIIIHEVLDITLHSISTVAIAIWHRANIVRFASMFLSIPISFTIRGVVSEKPLHDVGRVTSMSTSLTEYDCLCNGVFTDSPVSHG